jgi:hypothetical protein
MTTLRKTLIKPAIRVLGLKPLRIYSASERGAEAPLYRQRSGQSYVQR